MISRDDIRDGVIGLLNIQFSWIDTKDKEVCECDTFEELALGMDDMREFLETLLDEFELEDIELSAVMGWTKVKNIVDYIDIALQDKLGVK